MKGSKLDQRFNDQHNCPPDDLVSDHNHTFSIIELGLRFPIQRWDNKDLNYKLTFARQKLLKLRLPLCLRAISYLRISCSVMQKFEGQNTPYSSLLKLLSEYNVEWWNDCEISPSGILRSRVMAIKGLLQPLTQLHDQHLSFIISSNSDLVPYIKTK